MKEKLQNIMNRGGWIVVIGLVAMAVSIAIMQWGDNFFYNALKDYEILIDENGYLYTNYGGDTEDAYILWETDGGKLSAVTENEALSLQYKEDVTGYFLYTDTDDLVKWEPADADGYEYTTVTIRATCYTADGDVAWYVVYDYIDDAELTITWNEETKKPEKAEETRVFSNPVREGDDTSWTQLYVVSRASEDYVTLRFRTGTDFTAIDNIDDLILRFESSESILGETDLASGLITFKLNLDNVGKKVMSQVMTVTVAGEGTVEAYLTPSANSDAEYGAVADSDKICAASITISK